MIKRRHFISLLGGAAAWPLAAHAQQPAVPVVGFLRSSTEAGFDHYVAGFRQGLSEMGYVEGRNITIEFRWSGDEPNQLPALAADLVSRRVSVVVCNHGAAAAAIAATKIIPIVFVSGEDPVTGGLVGSLNRPGGNVTGVTFFDIPLSGKRLGLLHELISKDKSIALLLNPAFSAADAERRELDIAARATGRLVVVVDAANEREIDSAFSIIAQSAAGALLVGGGPLYLRQNRQLIALAARLKLPAIYVAREYVEAGGLMSYGASHTDSYRRAAGFVSRILKGERPGDIPVELPTKFDLAINLKAVKALGLEIPPGVLAIADEVIE